MLLFARGVPWGEVWSGMRAASLPVLLLALAANYAACAARTALWWRLLRAVGIPSLGLAVRATIVGMVLHCVLVGNAGEAGRVLLVTRSTGASATTVIASVVLERLAVSAGYVAVLIVAGIVLPLPPPLDRWKVFATMSLCVGGVLIALLARERSAPRSNTLAQPPSAWRRTMNAFRASAGQAVAGAGVAVVLCLTAVNWAGQIATFHLTAKAVGLPISLGGSVVAMLVVLASGTVRATPGNLGVTQLAYVAAAGALGLSTQLAMGVALLLQAIQTVPVVMASVFVLPDLGMRRARAT